MSTKSPRNFGMTKFNIMGYFTLILLVAGIGGWAVTTEISGAVIASGEVVVESDIKIVQHQGGGVIGELLVRNRSLVEEGDVLLRIDGTFASAELGIVNGRLNEFYARRALAVAERDEQSTIEFPAALLERADDPAVAEVLSSTQSTFDLRREARNGQVARLRQQIVQLTQKIDGFAHQTAAKTKEMALVKVQLELFRQLLSQNLTGQSKVAGFERDIAGLEGELGQLTASAAEAKGRISELEVQILQVSQEARSQAASELQTLSASISEHEERRITSLDQLKRLEIRAPQSGIVHEMNVSTVGGVISPGDPLMKIVPIADELVVEADVAPSERDQLETGQVASLSFAAFNQRATPRIEGLISNISPSTSINSITGAPYYAVRITMSLDQMKKLGQVEVLPGMLVTAFITTSPRTFAEYLIAPLTEQIERAFRGR